MTVYDSSFSDTVKMTDMSFTSGLGRTYKYWTGPKPLWEFGTGLSLTTFEMTWSSAKPPPPVIITSSNISSLICLSVTVSNIGEREGDEVVMVYHIPVAVQRPTQESELRLPHRRLLDFERVSLGAGSEATVVFSINASALGLVDSEGNTCVCLCIVLYRLLHPP